MDNIQNADEEQFELYAGPDVCHEQGLGFGDFILYGISAKQICQGFLFLHHESF